MIGFHLNGNHLGGIEYIYPVHGHNIHSLATVNYQLPRGKTLFHLPLTNILEIFKDFSACKIVLAAIHQQPEKIQRLFRLQICLSRKSSTIFRKYSKTFWAINSSNQQQQSTAATSSSNQQQQPAAAINSSNQQQQSTAATSSSNQQQQPTAAISNSNQQQQPKAATSNNNQLQQQPAFVLPAPLPPSTTTHVR